MRNLRIQVLPNIVLSIRQFKTLIELQFLHHRCLYHQVKDKKEDHQQPQQKKQPLAKVKQVWKVKEVEKVAPVLQSDAPFMDDKEKVTVLPATPTLEASPWMVVQGKSGSNSRKGILNYAQAVSVPTKNGFPGLQGLDQVLSNSLPLDIGGTSIIN
ncbi:hypothetical protein HAX54_010811 [Datura stramonium]|uniref:Uncharacterized protein n=1 Tax=Datura stramonium TaxID=4076 RepID=A0ABS8RWR1_DATST|nr:hypothetical protein [Datura stramonium]